MSCDFQVRVNVMRDSLALNVEVLKIHSQKPIASMYVILGYKMH